MSAADIGYPAEGRDDRVSPLLVELPFVSESRVDIT
jgi:hypothetical protein